MAVNISAAEERYPLEVLISSQLARLTFELSEHQTMLMELRSLREKAAIALHEKLAEADNVDQEDRGMSVDENDMPVDNDGPAELPSHWAEV